MRQLFGRRAYNNRMTKRYPYSVYVVGVFIAWAIVLLVALELLSTNKFHNILIFGSGFMLGVLGASLARKVYK